MVKTDVNALDRLDLDWKVWRSLDPDDSALSAIPTDEGIYRVRYPEYRGLVYVGETGRSTRGRIRSLARGTYADEMPFRDPHTAAPCLWAIRDADGSAFEVSYTTPSIAEDDQQRKGIEAALIALHRREIERSPIANFGRIIEGYEQSSYSKDVQRGRRLPNGETEPNAAKGVGPTEWRNVGDVIDREWMGFGWSEPSRLADRLDTSPPRNGLYRIWYEGETPPLAYIGESSDIPSRLYDHEQTFGGDALFATVDRPDLDARHKRQEIETELIGAHHIAHDRTPLAQFGYDLDRSE
jgi:hypothetical protein